MHNLLLFILFSFPATEVTHNLFPTNHITHYLLITGASEVTNAQPLSCKSRLLILFSFPATEVTHKLFPKKLGYFTHYLLLTRASEVIHNHYRLLILFAFPAEEVAHNIFSTKSGYSLPSRNQGVRGYSQPHSGKYGLLILFSFLTT
jgi:hypothetical protein